MEKTLQVTQPPIFGLLRWAYTLNITSSYEKTLPWFYSNFIQMYGNKHFLQQNKEFYFDFYRGGRWEFNNNNPYLLSHNTGMDLLQHLRSGITELAIDFINQEYYPVLYIDEYYISYSFAYQSLHLPHHLMIYGYDDDRKIFHTMAFGKKGSFSKHEVSFKEVETAFQSMFRFIMNEGYKDEQTYFFKFNHDYEYSLDLTLIKNQLRDYVESKTSENTINRNTDNDAYGLETYDYLQLYFEACSRKDPNLFNRQDVRQLHILYEHKKIMVDRINYLTEKGCMSRAEKIRDGYKALIDQSFLLRHSIMKARSKKEEYPYAQMFNQFDSMKNQEQQLLEALIDLL
ncbi:hypothetical protein BC351_39075 [Paenibacillus ferrarius]|uniref:Butirosin biosynthesis protein H N-terminal domain-containing protein n=1 Tax=Paenibacillus ferrarius TaxID=1469647 RepID=A0A1V4H9M5_9BACL|nr:hypothetical protein [Paenibacillus ferrarius]OPH47993.1 hypothetical protein BC351_39075 [Paenibacillus ferrarius]